MSKLNSDRILGLIISKMYYDEMGYIRNNLGITEITTGTGWAEVVLIVSSQKNYNMNKNFIKLILDTDYHLECGRWSKF